MNIKPHSSAMKTSSVDSGRAELDWLAFRYIAGELNPEELSSFEFRLADDQSAREAVARAVHVAEITALAQADVLETSRSACESRVPSIARTSWMRRVAWMACGAAACLLFVLLARPFENRRGSTPTAARSMEWNEADPELALAWAQTRSTIASDLDETEDNLDSISLHESEAGNEGGLAETDLLAPSWMLTAVVGLHAAPELSDSSTN